MLRVTNLADSGPGSLRAAVEARGPRTILFDVAGTIRLASDLVIREPRVTIAGQSAPGGGIALADATLIVHADDVVIRHIRARRGDRAPGEGDSIWIARRPADHPRSCLGELVDRRDALGLGALRRVAAAFTISPSNGRSSPNRCAARTTPRASTAMAA